MTTTTTQIETNVHASGMPSQRDFEIFRLAVIKGFTHKELAGLFEVSRRRVSQIVENVRNWLSQHPCEDPNIATELQTKRLAQHLERMHLEDIISQARHEVAFGKRQLITTSEKADGSKTTTYREQPFNVQVLKTYLRAVEALGRINARPEIPLPPPSGEEFPWLITAVNEVYEKWWDKIWSKKLKSEMIHDFVNDIIIDVLKAAKHQQELAARPADDDADANAAADGAAAADRDDDDSVGNALRGVPCASSDVDQADTTAVGRGSPDPAQAATEGLPSESTEYSVPSTPAHAPAADASDQQNGSLSPSLLVPLSSPSTSRASLPEAPALEQSAPRSDALTADSPDTSVATTPSQMSRPDDQASQENPKREAPPPFIPPSRCPSVTPA